MNVGMLTIQRPRAKQIRRKACSDSSPNCETRCGLYNVGKITAKGTFSDVRLAGDASGPVGKYLLKIQDITPGRIEPNSKMATEKVFENEVKILEKISGIGPKMIKHWVCSSFGKKYGYILIENWCHGYEERREENEEASKASRRAGKCGDLSKFEKIFGRKRDWTTERATKWINRMIEEYKKIHDIGVVHKDNHLKNILYRKRKGSRSEIALIDFGFGVDFTGKTDAEKADLLFLDLAGLLKLLGTGADMYADDERKFMYFDN